MTCLRSGHTAGTRQSRALGSPSVWAQISGSRVWTVNQNLPSAWPWTRPARPGASSQCGWVWDEREAGREERGPPGDTLPAPLAPHTHRDPGADFAPGNRPAAAQGPVRGLGEAVPSTRSPCWCRRCDHRILRQESPLSAGWQPRPPSPCRAGPEPAGPRGQVTRGRKLAPRTSWQHLLESVRVWTFQTSVRGPPCASARQRGATPAQTSPHPRPPGPLGPAPRMGHLPAGPHSAPRAASGPRAQLLPAPASQGTGLPARAGSDLCPFRAPDARGAAAPSVKRTAKCAGPRRPQPASCGRPSRHCGHPGNRGGGGDGRNSRSGSDDSGYGAGDSNREPRRWPRYRLRRWQCG